MATALKAVNVGNTTQSHAAVPSHIKMLTPLDCTMAQTEGDVTDPVRKFTRGGSHQVPPEFLTRLKNMITNHYALFCYELKVMTGYQGLGGKFHIDLVLVVHPDTHNLVSTRRRYAEPEIKIGDETCQELLDADFIEHAAANCQFALPCRPRKVSMASIYTLYIDMRFYTDFRPLNAKLVRDHYGLPLPEDIMTCMADASYYTKLDLKAIVSIHDRRKTAF